jgi:hypothetical protein
MTRIRIAELPPIEEMTREDMERILGAGRFRPSLEALEKRELMDAGLKFAMLDPLVAMKQHVMETVRAATDATSTASQTQQATEWSRYQYAPFIDVTQANAIDVMRAAMKQGVKYFNWGFIQWDNGHWSWGAGNPLGGDVDKKLLDFLPELHKAGGDVRISFGGQTACDHHHELAMVFAREGKTPAQLAAAIQDVMNRYGVKRIDFDIEGEALRQPDNKASLELRSQAMKLIQQADKDVKIDITLPAEAKGRWDTPQRRDGGLDDKALDVVKSALQHGVDIEHVNLMTMCFGAYYTKDKDGPDAHQKAEWEGAKEAAEIAHDQLRDLYGKLGITKTDAELWHMIGLTAETGSNDNSKAEYKEEFTVKDAQELNKWATERGIGMLSMWSLTREKSLDGGKVDPLAYVAEFRSFTRDNAGGLALQGAWNKGIEIHTPGVHYWDGILLRTDKMPPTRNVLIDWGDGTKPELCSWEREGNGWVVRGAHLYTDEGTYQTRWQNLLMTGDLQARDAAFASVHHGPQQARDATKVQSTEAVFTGTAVAGRVYRVAHASLDAYYSHAAADALLSGQEHSFAW